MNKKLKTLLKGVTISVITLLSANTFSQGYMDDIALESCKCLDKVSDTLNSELYNMELGLCMIEAATPYKKQLKKDYKIDFNKIEEHGEELGKIIGFKMASVCPEALTRVATRMTENDMNQSNSSSYEGYITKIEDNQFIIFSIKDSNGKTTKFYWLSFIETDYDIELTAQYKILLDEIVRITYVTQEFFDYRIGEYRNFNIIQKIQSIN